MYICIHVHIYIHMHMYTYVHVYIYICIRMYMCTYACGTFYFSFFANHAFLCASLHSVFQSEGVFTYLHNTLSSFFANHAFLCAFSCLSVSERVCTLIYTTHLSVCSFRVRLIFSEHVYISTQHAFRCDASVSVCQSLGVYISIQHNSLCVPSVSAWYSVGVFTHPLNSPSSMILWCLYISQLVCLHIHTPRLPVCSFRVCLIFSGYILHICITRLPAQGFGVCLSESECVYASAHHTVLSIPSVYAFYPVAVFTYLHAFVRDEKF